MKTVCKENQCTSCTACINICPAKCIHIINEPSYSNAVIDSAKCLNCKQCYTVCQQNHFLINMRNQPLFLIGKMNDEKDSMKSSSGGIATLISRQIIERGGYVCGCQFKNGEFLHCLTNKINEIENFRGSKYVKSNLGLIFGQIKRVIRNSKVLFIGTPCQVYGLQKYLASFKLLDNLYTIDLVCHGTPQQILLTKYLNEEYKSKSIQSIQFRDKTNISLIINSNYKLRKVYDPYTIAFLNGLTYTNNCYSCQFSNTNRVGDITLGDAWGIGEKGSTNGLSLIISNTKKGASLLDSLGSKASLKVFDKKLLIDNNKQLYQPSKIPIKRNWFFSNINNTTFRKLIKKIYKKAYFRQKMKEILLRFGFIKS